MGCQALKGVLPTSLAAPWSLRKGLLMRSGILCPTPEKELLPMLGGGPCACETTFWYEMDLRGGGWWNGDASAW